MEGVSLNKQGLEEAQRLPGRLANTNIDVIISSPLQRCLETAKPIAEQLNLHVETNEGFNEIDFGDWTDVSFAALENDPEFVLFNRFRSNTRIPGGETMAEAQLRIVQGLQEAAVKYQDRTIAIISHADMIKAAIMYYMCMPLDLFTRVEISPASVSILEIFDDNARVLLLNHVGDIKM